MGRDEEGCKGEIGRVAGIKGGFREGRRMVVKKGVRGGGKERGRKKSGEGERRCEGRGLVGGGKKGKGERTVAYP